MEKLRQEVQTVLGIQLTTRQLEAFQTYERELSEWNNRFNLTAIRDIEGIRKKHFLDAISCLLAMRDTTGTRLIDVGTGAGFPGIPIKIMVPGLRVTLVESVGKKAEFCRHIIHSLRLEGVDVLQARAEETGQMTEYREQYDWAVARAVANMPVLMEYLLPLVKVGGRVLSQKGESGPAETQSAENAMQLLGGRLRQLTRVTLPGVADERYLIVVDKIAATPSLYPRRIGVPAKSPL